MKNKLLVVMLTTSVLGTNVISNAAEIDVDFQNSQFVVSGEIDSGESGRVIQFMVLNPEKAISDMEGDSYKEALQNVRYTKTTDGGKYNISLPLSKVNEKEGYFTIYIESAECEEFEVLTKYYAGNDSRRNIIRDINNASSATSVEKLEAAIEPLSLRFEAFEKCDISDIAALVYKDKERLVYDENDSVKAQLRIKQMALLCSYNSAKADVCYTDENSFDYSNIIDMAEIDKDGVTLYNVYNTVISEEGKKTVRELLLNQNYSSVQDLYDRFEELVFVYGVKSAVGNGTGDIKKVITKENAEAVNVSAEKYLNIKNSATKGMAENKLLTESFDTPAELINKLNDIIKNTETGTNGGGTGGGGGYQSGTTSQGGMVPIGSATGTNIPAKNNNFSDIDGVEWAKEAIDYLFEKNIIKGTGNGKFRPQNNITREQFAVILVNASGYELADEDSDFEDVLKDSYYAQHVATAKKIGVVNGISDNKFGVGENITRQDLCVMVYRAWFSGMNDESSTVFFDEEDISDYAKDAVSYLSSLGIVKGFEDGSFKPNQPCTRAQAAKIVYESLKIK